MAEEIEQENIIQNRLFLETELKKEGDSENETHLVKEGTLRELIQTITNPNYQPIFNNIINVNDWTIKIKKDQEVREPKLDRHTQQSFNAVVDWMIRENNANIFPHMLANNVIRDSLTLENNIEQQEDQNKQLPAKIETKLDVYLCGDDNDDNNEQLSGPEDMYIGHKYENNISRILHNNPLNVNDSVTTESVGDMLFLQPLSSYFETF